MRVVIFGGSGFIGTNLAEELVSQGYTVRIFSRSMGSFLEKIERSSEIEWVHGDFMNSHEVEGSIRDCDIIYHLLSTTLPKDSNEDPVFDLESNVVGTIRLLEAAKRCHVRKVIFASSGGTVYGIPREIPISETHPTNPICAYGIGKLAIEKYLSFYYHNDGPDYTILRLANPYGPFQDPSSGQGVIPVFLQKAINNEAIKIWGDGSVVRDYLYISDAIKVMTEIIHYSGEEKIFNLGSGTGTSLNDIIKNIELSLDKPVKRVYTKARKFDVPTNILDISRIKSNINWAPKVSLDEGINRTLKYIMEYAY